MNPRTKRTPSSNASHGLRSRHWALPGSFTWPPAILSGATRPADDASRVVGQGVEQCQAERGRDRCRAQVALDALEDRDQRCHLARRVEVEQLVRSDSPPSRTGKRSRRNDRTSAPSGSAARAMSPSSTGAWRCSPPPSWSRQTGHR